MKDGFEKSIGLRLQHAARLQRALAARRLHELGLFPGQETVMKLLVDNDGCTMSELANTLRVRPPTASKTVGRLAAQGLVVRKASDSDARLVRVHLTDEGRSRAGAIDAIWESLEETIIGDLDGKDRKRLRKLLRRIERNLSVKLGAEGADIEEHPEEIEEPA